MSICAQRRVASPSASIAPDRDVRCRLGPGPPHRDGDARQLTASGTGRQSHRSREPPTRRDPAIRPRPPAWRTFTGTTRRSAPTLLPPRTRTSTTRCPSTSRAASTWSSSTPSRLGADGTHLVRRPGRRPPTMAPRANRSFAEQRSRSPISPTPRPASPRPPSRGCLAVAQRRTRDPGGRRAARHRAPGSPPLHRDYRDNGVRDRSPR